MRRIVLALAAAVGCTAAAPGGGETGTAASSTTAASAESELSSVGSDDGEVSTSVEGDCAPTDASVRDSVFVPQCATQGCHDAAAAAAGLDLSTGNPADTLVGRASGTCDGAVLVVPGDPEGSFLIEKLGPSPTCGGVMPPTGAVSSDDIACLEAWVLQVSASCETCGEAACVETDSDPAHCGACDAACPEGVACMGGMCACPDGTEVCDMACVDVASDPAHCGGCGQPCADNLFCLLGECAEGCGALTECDGACVDTASSVLHCGGCDAPCGAGEACAGGACGCDAPATSYARDVEPTFVADCASMGCHRPMGPNDGAEDLNLAAGSGYSDLVGVDSMQCGGRALVQPGSPSQSYLMDKLLGINLCSGTLMPKNGGPLTPAEIQVVEDWICSGAAP